MREEIKQIVSKITPSFLYPLRSCLNLPKTLANMRYFPLKNSFTKKIKDSDTGYNFKGFIDLVIRTSSMENFTSLIGRHVLGETRPGMPKSASDKYITYQLTLYKKFWCQKYDVDPKLVETYTLCSLEENRQKKITLKSFVSGTGGPLDPRKVENCNKTTYNCSL